MKLEKIIKFALLIILLASASSCMNYKKIGYLQDMTQDSQIELENRIEAVIAPNDELTIYVSCFDQDIAKPFNLFSGQNGNYLSGNSGSGNNRYGYLVDEDGYIQFPILGNIKVAGLTRLKVQDKIAAMLKEGGYISDPFVYVRFTNFKIFFLGADGGKSINIPNERCTFLEALALSGDLDSYTRRDKIAVMREVNGKMTMRYLDPRSSKVFNDPYYILQQNDFIITQTFKAKYFSDEAQYWLLWITTIASLSSVAAMFIMAFK